MNGLIRNRRPTRDIARLLHSRGFKFAWVPVIIPGTGESGWLIMAVAPGSQAPPNSRPFRRDRFSFQRIACN